jgi:hypothetical protein
MKRIYSIILLFSFFTGVIQPVMPMVEYIMSEATVMSLFSPDEDSDICFLEDIDLAQDHISENCGCCDTGCDTPDSLLDTDFFPVHLQPVTGYEDQALSVLSLNNRLTDERTFTLFSSTLSPPPRMA